VATLNVSFLKKKSYRRTQSWCAQTLGSHQHILQLFKNTFLSRNLDQICLKCFIFWEKKHGKFAKFTNMENLQNSPQLTLASSGWGSLPPDP